MEIFERLGHRLEEAWRARDWDELALPELSAEALREADLPRHIGYLDVIRWLTEAPRIPEQDDIGANFGHPPITVFSSHRLFISVICWETGATSIHRHAFRGAFQVLHGTSLHVRFAFTTRARVNARFLLGDLTTRSAELLERGDIVAIPSDLVHVSYHLDSPTVTVVIRTWRDEDAVPQYDYHPPHVAFDPFNQDAFAMRQAQALHFLWRIGDDSAEGLARALIERCDLETCYKILREAHTTAGAEKAAPLVVAARERRGAVIDELMRSIEVELRRNEVQRLRDEVDDPDHKLFLGLLLNLFDRDSIESVLRRRYPGEDVREKILGWLGELSGVDRIGVDLDDDLNRALVRALLSERSPERALEMLKDEFEDEEVDAQKEALLRHCARLRATVLAPLFESDPG